MKIKTPQINLRELIINFGINFPSVSNANNGKHFWLKNCIWCYVPLTLKQNIPWGAIYMRKVRIVAIYGNTTHVLVK